LAARRNDKGRGHAQTWAVPRWFGAVMATFHQAVQNVIGPVRQRALIGYLLVA
jgi:hypothetical protein